VGSEAMKSGFRWLVLLGAMLALSCEDNRPAYPLGAYEDAGESQAGHAGQAGEAGAAGAPEAGQSAGGAGGRTTDAG
jgi:hypothetical protein